MYHDAELMASITIVKDLEMIVPVASLDWELEVGCYDDLHDNLPC